MCRRVRERTAAPVHFTLANRNCFRWNTPACAGKKGDGPFVVYTPCRWRAADDEEYLRAHA